ncbi:hypothetical protein [Methylobacterium oryzae]|uniref:hypothetical protein n=1 Tax=Methylobacterium oryzae TaxID=334852 RepID=UPI002F35A922
MQTLDNSKPGFIAHIAPRTVVLKILMAGSYATPIRIIHPIDVDLITWSFFGFSERQISDPSCLLVLSCQEERTFFSIPSIVVRTHICDQHIVLSSTPIHLSHAEMSCIAKAIVSSLKPEILTNFDALIPILSADLDAILQDCATGDFTVRISDRTDIWVVNGLDFVPDCVIVRLLNGYACSSIESVRFHAARRATITLTTSVPMSDQSVSRVILSGNGRYVAARVIGAM